MNFTLGSIKTARSFAVHYGTNHLKALSEYDLAIIEPKAHRAEDINILRNNATAVYGYISLFEIEEKQPEFEVFGSHLLVEGISCQTEKCSRRHFVDLRSGPWIEFVLSRVRKLIAEYGYDGIFVDTVGYIEECVIQESIMFNQILAVCDFYRKVRKEFPEAGIIQNNALGLTLNYTKSLIDAVCWENPNSDTPEFRRINKLIISKLNRIRKENGMRVLLLTEDAPEARYFRHMTSKNSYIYYDAPKDYIGPVR